VFHEQPASMSFADAVSFPEYFEPVPTLLLLLRADQSPQVGPGAEGCQAA